MALLNHRSKNCQLLFFRENKNSHFIASFYFPNTINQKKTLHDGRVRNQRERSLLLFGDEGFDANAKA
jgi:hypothetical protein